MAKINSTDVPARCVKASFGPQKGIKPHSHVAVVQQRICEASSRIHADRSVEVPSRESIAKFIKNFGAFCYVHRKRIRKDVAKQMKKFIKESNDRAKFTVWDEAALNKRITI